MPGVLQKADFSCGIGLFHSTFPLMHSRSARTSLYVLTKSALSVDQTISEVSFPIEWDQARNGTELQGSLLHDDRFLVLQSKTGKPSGILTGKSVREAGIPRRCLAAMLTRDGESFVPSGRRILQEGDELTVIGEDEGMDLLRDTYLPTR